jgi:hypothetical protein
MAISMQCDELKSQNYIPRTVLCIKPESKYICGSRHGMDLRVKLQRNQRRSNANVNAERTSCRLSTIVPVI